MVTAVSQNPRPGAIGDHEIASSFCYASPIILPTVEPSAPMDDPDLAAIKHKLAELRSEHRDLDDVIARVQEAQPFDQLQLQRLKKRKLALKDQIARLESRLLPDIIA
jgi:hypothetical protein